MFVELIDFPAPKSTSDHSEDNDDDGEDSDDNFFYSIDKPEISLMPVLKPRYC